MQNWRVMAGDHGSSKAGSQLSLYISSGSIVEKSLLKLKQAGMPYHANILSVAALSAVAFAILLSPLSQNLQIP